MPTRKRLLAQKGKLEEKRQLILVLLTMVLSEDEGTLKRIKSLSKAAQQRKKPEALALFRIAYIACRELSEAANAAPKLFSSIARYQASWPLLVNPLVRDQI